MSNSFGEVFAAHKVASLYGYIPTRWITILFLSLFSLSTAAHTAQAVFYRKWWIFPTVVIAGILEIIGWGARLWSSHDPRKIEPFQMQITGTILGPTPLLASVFIILGQVIRQVGPVYSRLNPKYYAILFCSFDFISLVIQGVGGGLASAEFGRGRDPAKGGNIMLGGIIFQMATLVVYMLCATEFLVRYLYDRPLQRRLPNATTEPSDKTSYYRGIFTLKLKLMAAALAFTSLCLLIRAIYRTIELSDGWTGRIITTEVYFNVLDGGMITLAMYTLNAAHPGYLLRSDQQLSSEQKSES